MCRLIVGHRPPLMIKLNERNHHEITKNNQA
nr:MAG TPA: hypothetical protein [Caudoviricetes sp.]